MRKLHQVLFSKKDFSSEEAIEYFEHRRNERLFEIHEDAINFIINIGDHNHEQDHETETDRNGVSFCYMIC